MIWHGEGRWSWETVYNMPIPIRKLWINKLNEILAIKQAAADPKNNKTPKKVPGSKTLSKFK